MKNSKKKIVIIGAGPAGLTTAWELVNFQGREYEIILLEAEAAVGGMAKTVVHNKYFMDVGGHRFFTREKKVSDWWNTFLPTQEKDGEPSFLLRQRKTRIYYRNTFFDYPVSLRWENIKKLGYIHSVRIAADYVKALIKPEEERSLEQFYKNRFGKSLYALFFEKYTEKLCGVHPREIHPKWGEQRVRGLSIGAILKSYSRKRKESAVKTLHLEDQFFYPPFGPGQFWDCVAEKCVKRGVHIRKNSPVKALWRETDGRVKAVTIQTSDGIEVIEGDFFVSTMPLRELVAGMQGVPLRIRDMAEGLPYRAFVSVGLVVDRLATDISDCWLYIQDERVQVCRIQFYENWSPRLSDGKHCFIALEYFCNKQDAFWSMGEEECCRYAVREAQLLGILREDVHVLDFHREQIACAYPGFYGGYRDIAAIKDYLGTIPNLYCVGRNGQHEYWNMDKCILSAQETADKIHYSCKEENI